MNDDLVNALSTARARRDVATYRPRIFDAKLSDHRAALAALAGDPAVAVVDTLDEQLEELVRTRAPRTDLDADAVRAGVELLLEGRALVDLGVWAYYPWLQRLVHVLPEELHRELRLDRNRLKITTAEQTRLLSLTVAVAGLSVGRAVVSTLLREGIGGEIRLADFDVLSLSNLNRLAGGVADLGISKVVLAAREIAEVDPYLRVLAFQGGVEEETLSQFVGGASVVVEECDDFAIKLLLRERAKEARVPVVMATSDRGMLDIERFDREPDRATFHGILDGIASQDVRGLTTKQKLPYVLRAIGAEQLGERMAASLLEVKDTLATWPQLGSDVVLGGAMVANAVRRMALDELTCSGRFYAELDVLVAEGQQAPLGKPRPPHPEPAATEAAPLVMPPPSRILSAPPTRDELRFVVACATLAPTAANIQPWTFEAKGASLRARVDARRSAALIDYEAFATPLALGAALEGAVLGAQALGFDATVDASGETGDAWELRLARTSRAPSAHMVELLRQRCSNRRTEPSAPVPEASLRALQEVGMPIDVAVVSGEGVARLGPTLGALDRLRFLSPTFRSQLFSEVRWTREEAVTLRDGLDIASLEFDATDLAVLEVLRTGAGMDMLLSLGLGRALGNAARTAFDNAGAALVLRSRGMAWSGLLDAGRGLLRLWLEATRLGLSVHPWGSPFLFQRLQEEDAGFAPWERAVVTDAAAAFGREVPAVDGLHTFLVLRISKGEAPTARSVRRHVDDVLSFV